MEYEVDAAETLLLKKIFILFRHVTSSVQIVAGRDGMNLCALNSSRSAWLNIKLGRHFFRRIHCQKPSGGDEEGAEPNRNLVVGAKNLCQALSIVIPSGAKNQGYSAVFLKDAVQGDDNTVKTMVALEKLIIRDEPHLGNVISFQLSCAGAHIIRSAIITFDEYGAEVPDDILWENWHYLRIQPTVLYKSINPYWSPFDDVAISYDVKRSDLSLCIVKSITKTAGRSKAKSNRRSGITGKITINRSHLVTPKFDEVLPYPRDITISLKELLSVTSFCESVKAPLSFIMRECGDPVIVIFGDAVEMAEKTTGPMCVQQIIKDATTEQDVSTFEKTLMHSQIRSWSGSLWMSSNRKSGDDSTLYEDYDGEDTLDYAGSFDTTPICKRMVSEEAATSKVSSQSIHTEDLFKDPLGDSLEDDEKHSRSKEDSPFLKVPKQTREQIYKTLALDFMPQATSAPSKSNGFVTHSQCDHNGKARTDEAYLGSSARDRDQEDSVYDQLAGIW